MEPAPEPGVVFAERALFREPGGEIKLKEAEQGNAEIGFSAAAVGDDRDGNGNSAEFFYQFDGLFDASAFGYDVFRDDHAFAGFDGKSAFENEFVVDFIRENGFELECPCDFLTDEETADRGGDDGIRLNALFRYPACEFGAEAFSACGIDEDQRALEKAVAVLPAAEFEMSGEESSRVLKLLNDLILSHSHLYRKSFHLNVSVEVGSIRRWKSTVLSPTFNVIMVLSLVRSRAYGILTSPPGTATATLQSPRMDSACRRARTR